LWISCQYLSSLFVLLVVGNTPSVDQISLPMGAHLHRSDVPVYSKPLAFLDYEIYRLNDESTLVSVWESHDEWFRITPTGFNPEAWVQGEYLRLDPSLPADSSAPYLTALQRGLRENIERNTPSACAVAIKLIERTYDGSSLSATSWGLWPIPEGETFPVFRSESGFCEISFDDKHGTEKWVPAEFVELTKPFPTGNPCTHIFKAGKYRRYVFTASSAYRKGPSTKLPPIAFYKKGETVDIMGEYAGGWFTTIQGPVGAVWFPTSDAIVADRAVDQRQSSAHGASYPMSGYTTATNLRLHAGPGADTAVLAFMPAANSYVILYEEHAGWYRILPAEAPTVAWVSMQYVRQAPDVELNFATASYYMPPLQPPPVQTKPESIPERETSLFEGPLAALFVPWTWKATFLVLLPFVLGIFARLAFRDFDFEKAGDYAFWVVAVGTLISIVALGVTFKSAIAIALVLLGLGIPSVLYPFYRLWVYIHVWRPSWGLKLKIRRQIAVSDKKNDKIIKPEVMSPVTKFEETDLEKRDEVSKPHMHLEIEPKPLSRIPLINTLHRATYKSQADTIRVVTDLVSAKEELGQAAARLDRLQDVAKRDKQTLAHDIEEEDEKHITRLLEEQVRQAQLRTQLPGQESKSSDQHSGRTSRSAEDDLRAAVAKETEAETAARKILAEERQKCEEKVRHGEMKREDVEHHLAVVEAILNRHTARRQ
jgi:hypothetical protein